MEEHPKKDIREIITRLTHPVSVVENRRILAETPKTNFLSIFKEKNNMVLYKNIELEEIKDSCTQTSKTIIELAKIETGEMSPDSLSPREDYQDEATFISVSDSEYTQYSCTESKPPVEPLNLNQIETDSSKNPSLIETFLRKTKEKNKCHQKNFKSQSCVDAYYISDPKRSLKYTKFTVRNTDLDVEKNFMLPTLSSEKKNLMREVRQASALFSPIRRGRSSSPKPKKIPVDQLRIPYIDQSETELSQRKETSKKDNLISRISIADRQVPTRKIPTPNPPNSFSKDMLRIDEMSLTLMPTENNSTICFSDPNNYPDTINEAITKLQDNDWNTALKGLAELTEMCKSADAMIMMPYMMTINQRLIQLLKSPRSHVCRTACQAAGHLFEYMKDTRGPEFNDIVDLLLAKTADANKFIRRDANLALDCMVTHVSTCQAIKALCLKGPAHKNNLVRSATVRLLICAVVIAGPTVILNPNNNEPTRKRIFTNLVKFLDDKSPDTRKYGERLYKVLSKERYFDMYLKKYVDREDLSKMKKALKTLSRKERQF